MSLLLEGKASIRICSLLMGSRIISPMPAEEPYDLCAYMQPAEGQPYDITLCKFGRFGSLLGRPR